MLKRILPVLGATFGGDTFSSRDAIESEASGLRLVLRGVSVKQLGKLLARAVDVLIDGLMVRKQGVDVMLPRGRSSVVGHFEVGGHS